MPDKQYLLEIDKKIAEFIESEADQLGMTYNEFIRYILGVWVRNNRPPMVYIQPLTMCNYSSNNAPDPNANISKRIMDTSFKALFTQGYFKCRHCTLPISFDDFKAKKCSNCQGQDPLGEDQ